MGEHRDVIKAHLNACGTGELAVFVEPRDVRSITLLGGESTLVYDLRHNADANGARLLEAIDRLRRELSGYHGQLKARGDLQRHCDNQRAELARLQEAMARRQEWWAETKAENARLRRAAERDADVLESLSRSPEDAQRENMELRGLVRDMYMGLHCPRSGTGEGCPSCELYDREQVECTIELRMRELGMDV